MLGQVGAEKQTAKRPMQPPANDAAAKPASQSISALTRSRTHNPRAAATTTGSRAGRRRGNGPVAALALTAAGIAGVALDSENSRTISLLINYLDIEVAGEVYKRLSPAKRKEVSLRFTEQTEGRRGVDQAHRPGSAARNAVALRDAVRERNRARGAARSAMAALLRGLERTERMRDAHASSNKPMPS